MNSNFHHHAVNAIRPTAYHNAAKNKNSLSVSSPISSRAFHVGVNCYNSNNNVSNGNGGSSNKMKIKSYIDCINESISFIMNCSCNINTTQSKQHKLSSSQSSRKHNMLYNSSSNSNSSCSNYDKLTEVIKVNNELLHKKRELEKKIEKAKHKLCSSSSTNNNNYDEYKTHHHTNYHSKNNRHSSNHHHQYHHHNQHTQNDNDEYHKLLRTNQKLHKTKKELEHHINRYTNKINSLDHNWVNMFNNSTYISDKLKDTVTPMEELITLFSKISSSINTSNTTISSPTTLQNNSTSNTNNK